MSKLAWTGWIFAAGMLLTGATEDATQSTLRVRRLAIVDAAGVERLILEADSAYANLNGQRYARRSPVSGLILQNAAGDERGGMGTNGDGDAVVALDGPSPVAPGAVDRVALFSLADGTAGLVLNDREMTKRAALTSSDEKAVSFEIFR
jgi:hypothetical protein